MVQGESFDVFLSYSRSDATAAGRLVQTLRSRGLKVFFDRDYLTPGQQWPELLEVSLRGCRSAAICLGPQGLGSWQKREQYVALDRQVQDSSFSVIPVLLPGAKDPPLGFLRLETWVDLKGGIEDEAGLDLLQQAIHGQAPLAAEVGLPDPRAGLCPFRGLEPFREEDAAFFVGREAFTRVLIDKVGQRPLIGVVGASGSGKSSVVLAGLVPALRRREDGRVWEIGLMRPGQYPLRQLAAAFLPPDPGLDEFARIAVLKERAQQLAAGTVTLADVVEATLGKQSGTDRLLLVIDQWEELYTQSKDAEGDREREDFLRVLLAGIDGKRLSVVLTLRGDFYGRALQDRILGDRLQDAVVNVSPMLRDELRRVIEEPAAKVGLSFEQGLVDEILSDVGNEPGNLPLLEFLLKELWDRRTGDRRLTFAAYGETGGVRRAIAERAEAELAKLSGEQKAAARRFMIRLVTPGEGQEDTRARVAIPQGNEAVRAVIERFAQARLLTTRFDPASGREVVEVGHEALIREWDTLKGWVDADREFLRTVQRVKLAMQVWQEETGDKTQRLLPPGRPLEEARELLARDRAEVDDIRPFIEASIARDESQQEKERHAREEQQQKELAAANERAEAARQLAEERARGEAAAKRLAEQEIARARMTRRMAIAGAVIVLAVFFGFAVMQTQSIERLVQAQASSIWSRLELEAELRPYEVEGIWQLAAAEPSTFESLWRRATGVPSLFEAFWSQVPGDVGHIVKLGKRPELLARTAGLDDRWRTEAVLASLIKALQDTSDVDQHAAIAAVLGALPVTLTSEQSAAIFGTILRPARHGLENAPDEPDRATLADVVAAVRPALTPDQAAAATTSLLQAMRAADSEGRLALAKAVAALVPALKSEPADAIDLVLQDFSNAKDPHERVELAGVLAQLVVNPASERLSPVVDSIFAVFQATTDVEQLASLAQSLRALAPKMKPAQAAAIAPAVVQSFQAGSGRRLRAMLAELLAALPVELTPKQVELVVVHVSAAAQNSRDRASEDMMFEDLAPILKPEQAAGALKSVLADLESAADPALRETPARTFRVLVDRVKPESAVLTPILRLLRDTTVLANRDLLVEALERLAPALNPADAADVARGLLEVFQPGRDSSLRMPFAHALSALVPKLQGQLRASAVDFVIQAFQHANQFADRIMLAELVSELPPDVRSEALGEAINLVVRSLESADRDKRGELARKIAAFAPRLAATQATAAGRIVLNSEQTAKVLSIVRTELANTGKITDGKGWAHALNRILRPRPEVDHVSLIIEVLKYPTVAGPPSDTLLAGLRARFAGAPAPGTDLREFVAWVKTRFPALAVKLDEPPVRPGS